MTVEDFEKLCAEYNLRCDTGLVMDFEMVVIEGETIFGPKRSYLHAEELSEEAIMDYLLGA